jgi:MEMO1 family protein
MNFKVFKILLFVILPVTLLCFHAGDAIAQVREPVVAGSFYPADAGQLGTQLASLFSAVDDEKTDDNIAAVIVPHAGYVFSGEVAASAFARLNPEKQFSRIFLIGTSHHITLNGASIYNTGDYQTPLGLVKVDTDLATRLIEENRIFRFVPGAHNREHSLEVQLPFLQYHLKKPFKIVPVIIGTQSAETCKSIAEALKPYFTPENLFVVSSDFSHYPSYADALKNDKITGDAVAGNSPDAFIKTITNNAKKNIPGLATSCCAWSSVLTLLNITSKMPGIKVHHVKYMNSGDSPYGDKIKVVGYHSFVFSREKQAEASFSLQEDEKILLLKMAREAIHYGLNNKLPPDYNEKKLPEGVKTTCGAFVTLTKGEKLRGCIGQFTACKCLYQTVQEAAQASAFRDRRFSPVEHGEMRDIEIEISVLTPLKRIDSVEEFIPEKHGIFIIKGNQSGTFLPRVATDTGWSREELLGHCAHDKAGIGWDGWKEAELYTYEALVFNETERLTSRK